MKKFLFALLVLVISTGAQAQGFGLTPKFGLSVKFGTSSGPTGLLSSYQTVINSGESPTIPLPALVISPKNSWCIVGTYARAASWVASESLFTSGTGANSINLFTDGTNLTFSVVDNTGATKYASVALTNVPIGSTRVGACDNDGALSIYVNGTLAGSAP